MSATLPALTQALSVAAWRGVTFHMVTSTDNLGRRAVQFWFPGVDPAAYDDLGAFDGPIRVQGLIIGDDVLVRARRMKAALLAPGPGTLVHPWWGELQCRLISPASLSFADREQRVARIEAEFVRDDPAAAPEDTLSALLDAADGLIDGAQLALRQLLAPLAIALDLAGMLSRLVGDIGGIYAPLISSAPEAVSAATAAPLASLQGGVTIPTINPDTTWADGVTQLLVATPAAIAKAVTSASQPAIATATLGTDETGIDPSVAATLLIGAAAQISAAAATEAAPGGTAAGAALVIGVVGQALTLAQAIAAASSISYASQPDALAWRDTQTAALDALAADLTAAASSTAGVQALASLWSAARLTRSAVVADISQQLGRLPALVDVTLPTQLSIWQVAYGICGNQPVAGLALMTDAVTRNAIRHPAMTGPGIIAVLEQPT